MNAVYPDDAEEILDVFCLYQGQGEYFCLADRPIVREAFSFGGDQVRLKGFRITEHCIGCGTCQSVCPQDAIDEGSPFVIRP